MNDHEKKGKVGGSVLFTVIVVMMVLVVFLMGTLGLASAANKRAQNSYTSSQAQYTARMAVESVLAAMQNDYVVAKTVNDLATGKMGKNSIPVEIDTSQLYPKDAGSIAAYGTVTSCTIERAGQDYYYVDNKWTGRDMIKITATAQLGSQENTVSAYIMKKDTTIKPLSGPGGAGAGLVAAGAATFGTATSVFGGTGINLNNLWRNEDPGNYDTKINLDAGNSTGMILEAPFVVNGNYKADGKGTTWGFSQLGQGVTIWGDFSFNNNIAIRTGNPMLKEANANKISEFKYTDIPYIYVDKTLKVTNGAKGVNLEEKIPLNIICGRADIATTNPIYGTLYMMNQGAANTITFGNDSGVSGSLLSKWTYKLVNGIDSNPEEGVGGSIYCNGDLTIDSTNATATVKGSVVVDGNLTIKTDQNTYMNNNVDMNKVLTIDGNLVVKGKLIISDQNNGDHGYVIVKNDVYHTETTDDKHPGNISYKNKENYDSSKGYPVYMTREYILGIKEDKVNGKEVSQYIDTLQDTMKTEMDPYKNACYGLPETYHDVVEAWDKANSSKDLAKLKELGTVMNTLYGNYLIRSYSESDAAIDKKVVVNPTNSDDIVITDTDVAVLKKGTYYKPIHVVPNEDHKTIWLIVEDGVTFATENPYGIIFEDCQLETEKIADTYNEDGNPRYKMKSTGDKETYKNFAKKKDADENGVRQGKYDLRILVLGKATFNGGGIWSRQYVSLSAGNVPFQIYTSGDCAVYKDEKEVYTPARPNIYVYANSIDPDILKDSDALKKIEDETHYRPTTTNACKYLNVNTSSTYMLSGQQKAKSVLTGYVVAPYMDVKWDAASDSFSGDVYYNGLNVNDPSICEGKSKTITFIGSVVAHDIDIHASASITMYYPAYIPDPIKPPEVKEPNYMKNWALVQFENY